MSQIHWFDCSALASMAHKKPTEYSGWKDGREFKTEYFEGEGGLVTPIMTVTRNWQQRAPVDWWRAAHPGLSLNREPPNDPRLVTITTNIAAGNLTKKQQFEYDTYNNQTDVYDYEYAIGTSGGSMVRHSHTSYMTVNPQNSIDYSVMAIHVRDLPASQTIQSGNGTIVSATEFRYDEPNLAPLTYNNVKGWSNTGTVAQGNLTSTKLWLNSTGGPPAVYPNGTYIETHAQYDQCGNIRNIWNGNGQQTSMKYVDSFADGVVRDTYAFPTETVFPQVPDPLHPETTLTFTASSSYDFSTGLRTASTDVNGQVTHFAYNDLLERLKQVTAPANGATVTYDYGDSPGNIFVRKLTAQNASQTLEDIERLDGIGRGIRSFHYRGAANYETVDTQYNATGKIWRVSNPYISSGPGSTTPPSTPWTTASYDELGRVKTVTAPDTSQVVTQYGVDPEWELPSVTVTDPRGRSRRKLIDCLGNTIRLDEPDKDTGNLGPTEDPVQRTTYVYNALNDLTSVSQGSQPPRNFFYDSLGRLLSATNPETGTTNYRYDNNNNLVQRTDARLITIIDTFDSLDRRTSRSYSDGTPTVSSTYDAGNVSNAKGRLVSISSNLSSYSFSGYDTMGRVTGGTQTIDGQSYFISQTYDLVGHILTQTYPSGHVVSYSYDDAGRVNSFAGNLGDNTQRTYSSEALYSSFGSLAKENFGTAIPIYNKLYYNSRGQLAEIREGTTYTDPTDTSWNRGALINFYGSCGGVCAGTPMPDNNGNLMRQEHRIPLEDQPNPTISETEIQEFEYDWLNRIKRVFQGTNWQQKYIYDRYGNRTIDSGNTWGTGIPEPGYGVDPNTNRLTAPQGYLISYDDAGNVKRDTFSTNAERFYDGANRLIQSGGDTYSYDGSGRRIKRTVNGNQIWLVYGLGGGLLAEYPAGGPASSPQKEYGYRSGQLLISAEAPGAYALAPSGLIASSAAANITLSWSAPAGATLYRVERKEPYDSYELLGTTNSLTFIDSWAGSHTAYLYRVCVANVQSYCSSGYSNAVLAARFTFPTDPTIISYAENPSNATSMKAAHITELQRAIDAVRELAELPLANWTTITPNMPIQAVHVQYLRQRLNEALNALGVQTSPYTESIVGFGENPSNATPIRAVHIRELRQRATSGNAGGGATGGPPQVLWLVTDQLGTPRMVFDQSGTLSRVSRHDYLPFGEELPLGSGTRTTQLGYGQPDALRQHFTQVERDTESTLDYFGTRYYSSGSGRFISPDQPFADQEEDDPQSWNMYAYVRNQTLRYTDAFGLWHIVSDDGEDVVFQADPGDHDLSGMAEQLGIPFHLLKSYFAVNGTKKIHPKDMFVFHRTAYKAWYQENAALCVMPANNSAFFQSSDDPLPEEDVSGLTIGFEWLTGTGPKHRWFGPRAPATKQMMTSPDVAQHRLNFIRQGGGRYRGTVKFGWFGAKDGPRVAGANFTRQVVGSFFITIQEKANGDALFTITNTSSFHSLVYSIPGVQNHERSEMGAMGNTDQEFWWMEKGLIKH